MPCIILKLKDDITGPMLLLLQCELGRRREDEIIRIRQDIEQKNTLHETQVKNILKQNLKPGD